MSKKNQVEYEHVVPKFLQMNRSQKSNDDEENIRTARANIDREDLGEEAPQIVEEDAIAIKEFQEAKKLEDEKRRKEEELRRQEIKDAEERAKILEKSKFSITDSTGHVFRSKNSSSLSSKDKSKGSKKKTSLSFKDSEDSSEDDKLPHTKILRAPLSNTSRKESDSENSVEDSNTKSPEKKIDTSPSADGQSLFKKRKRPQTGVIVNEKNSKTKTSDAL